MRHCRIDRNQPEIVRALRKIGCTVAITSRLGGGFPDIVVGIRGRNYLIELKDGEKPPSAQKLTDDERVFHLAWEGQIDIVRSVDEALELVQSDLQVELYPGNGL